MRRARHAFVSCLALLLAAPAALAEVLVVAPSGAPFTEISYAVAVAQPGDIVLVKSGLYLDYINIWKKSVSVIAEAGGSVTLLHGVEVGELQASDTVVLRGLKIVHPGVMTHGLKIYSCAGVVRVEDCSFRGKSGFLEASHGARVTDSSDVSFAHCTFEGGNGWIGDGTPGFLATSGGAGVATFQSSVSVWQSTLIGGKGGPGGELGSNVSGTPGGIGGSVNGGTLVLDGCTLVGGLGGRGGIGGVAGPGGDGGDAMHLVDGLLRLTDTHFFPGAGGPGGNGFSGPSGPPGAPGVTQVVLGGTLVPYSSAARDLTVNSPVRSGETANITFGVVSCDAVFLLVSATTQDVWFGAPQGTLVPGLPLISLSLALPCATGTLPFAAPIPALPAGIEGVHVYLQALHDNSTDGLQLGPFSVLTLLDASIP